MEIMRGQVAIERLASQQGDPATLVPMQVTLHHHDLQLRAPFRIARSTTTVRRTLIVELSDGTHSGYGEVSDNSYYPQADPRVVAELLEALRQVLAKADPDAPEQLHATCTSLLSGNSFAQCALDMAAHDLAARRANKPLWKFWGYDYTTAPIPVSNYTLSIGNPQAVLAQALANPWPSYKVKLGGGEDLTTVRLLRERLPASTRLHVDANAGWTLGEAFAKTRQLHALDVGFVEQPLPADAVADMRSLRDRLLAEDSQYAHHSPLIADEACQTEADVERCAGLYDGINIKLTKCGGPTVARRMALRASELGLDVMFGCMVESSFGIGVLQHFAPVSDYIDLDGALLVSNDPGQGVTFDDDGRPVEPTRPGSGIEWR